MKIATFPHELWAGTEASLNEAIGVYAAIQNDLVAAVASGYVSGNEDEPEQRDKPYNFELQGNVGVISIRGPLLNVDNEWARYRGATTYPDIRRALIYGAQQADAKMLLLDIDSGGGAVSGVEDTATLIRSISADLKPIYTLGGGTIASAAYWLGASADKIYGGATTTSGSIGVITTHMEMSKLYKEAGIGVTVVRSGEFKALANNVEPLTKAGEKQLQDQVDATDAVFTGYVAERRGTTVQAVNSTMGKGRVFTGQAGVDVGLLDGMTSFDRLVGVMNQHIVDKEAANQSQLPYSPQRNNMPRQALTAQQIAELATQKPEAVAAALAAAGLTELPAPTAPAATTPATPAAGTVPAAPDQSQVLAYLQGQVLGLNNQVKDLTAERDAAKADADAAKAVVPTLSALVAASVKTMRVALSLPEVDHAKSTTDALLADHAAVSSSFEKQFKTNGVAASAAVQSLTNADGDKPGRDPLALAAATRAVPLNK